MGFDALPSVATILAEASAWANPFFAEFSWTIGFVVGLAVLVGVISFLPSFVLDLIHKYKMTHNSNYSMTQSRNQAYTQLRQNQQIDKDFALWRKLHPSNMTKQQAENLRIPFRPRLEDDRGKILQFFD